MGIGMRRVFALVVRFHNPNSFGYWALQHAVTVINNYIYFHFQFCFFRWWTYPTRLQKVATSTFLSSAN